MENPVKIKLLEIKVNGGEDLEASFKFEGQKFEFDDVCRAVDAAKTAFLSVLNDEAPVRSAWSVWKERHHVLQIPV